MDIVIEEYGRAILAAVASIAVLVILTMAISGRLTEYTNDNLSELDATNRIENIVLEDKDTMEPRVKEIELKKGNKYRVKDLFEIDGNDDGSLRIISITDPDGVEYMCGEDEMYEFAMAGRYIIYLNYHGRWAFNVPVNI